MNFSDEDNDSLLNDYDLYDLACLALTYLVEVEDLDINAD